MGGVDTLKRGGASVSPISEMNSDEAPMSPEIQVNKYIVTAFEAGSSKGDIKKALLKAGWPRGIVKSGIKRYIKEQEAKKAEEEARKEKELTSPLGINVEGKKTGDSDAPKVIVSDFSKAGKDTTVIRLSNVSKYYGKNKVLDGINLEVKKGELIGIIGLSGSGKTTLLSSMIGFVQPEEGDVYYLSPTKMKYFSVFKKSKEIKRAFGFASQDPSFYAKLTTEENLNHFGSLYKIPRSERKGNIDKLLSQMELLDARKTLSMNLSGGMQRRLGLACSLIHNPPVLILDEPTADLDPFLRRELWNLILDINRSGTTVLVASHFLDEIEEHCSKIGILHKGRVMELGTPSELKERYSKSDEVHLELESKEYEKFQAKLKKEKLPIEKTVIKDGKLIVYTPKAEGVLHRILHLIEKSGDRLMDVDVNRPSLGEVFEALVEKEAEKALEANATLKA